ncbi:hypothetical protein QR680_000989 [Steinernema hermaphroditum]|uniref:ribonuclease H n=1 Tax=Steinernema hermaphroditum TaxID=289476 RepID=A0AA39GXF6_9BILA|nr:hypothetical protein QR680_000989 [Steinernema hermaphroditum]
MSERFSLSSYLHDPDERFCRPAIPEYFRDAAVVYTSGVCLNNGQDHLTAGYGVFWGSGHPNTISRPVYGSWPTNQRAELLAVRSAMRQALRDGFGKMIIRTDSMYIINSFNCWIHTWKENGWLNKNKMPVSNRYLIQDIDRLRCHLPIFFQHVRAHNGVFGNLMADRLAKHGEGKTTNLAETV